MNVDDFRRRVLTILGAIGYMVALLMMLVDILPAYEVGLQSIFIVLATSSALLGVDFGIDVFGVLEKHGMNGRPHKPDAEKHQHTDGTTTNNDSSNERT